MIPAYMKPKRNKLQKAVSIILNGKLYIIRLFLAKLIIKEYDLTGTRLQTRFHYSLNTEHFFYSIFSRKD